jgi:putative Ca2+/H+ antiporter (TMEM165/GDT1 family)
MDQSVVLTTFSLVFLAELGDKSQLLAMTLAHRYRAVPVVAGTFAAFALLNLLAVVVGQALAELIPQQLVLLVAGLLFLYFGHRAWQDAGSLVDQDTDPRPDCGGFVISFTMILVAEFGDKTQLAVIALAAGTGEIWAVFAGGTLALWAVSLLGILFGATVLRRVPRHWVHRAAAVMFIAFGVVAIGHVIVAYSVTIAMSQGV